MKKTILLTVTIASTVMVLMIACTGSQTGKEQAITQDSLVKKGEYLVTTMGCDDCHTPKKMGAAGPELDLEHRFGGHIAKSQIGHADMNVMKDGWVLFNMNSTAYAGPWGISYAANISSDGTGIGNWSEEQFFTAMRNGKAKGIKEGRDMMPPMPWQAFSKLNDVDMKAIYAYLKSTAPINNLVPGPTPITEVK